MKKILLLVIMSMTIFMVTACGNGGKKGNAEKNTATGENDTSISDNQQDDINVDNIVEEKVEFESFLVERCVRKALGKSWDEDITTRELAKIKELVIQEVYNPTFVAELVYEYSEKISEEPGVKYQSKYYYKNIVQNMTYIDLSDLKYFVNLETLKIDNISTDSMLANIDAITNCKKLKELSLLYNFSGETSKNFGGVGYLYWANIISELPELKTVDFSTYIDEHAKNVLLSKTSNKDIKFVQYDADKVGRLYWRTADVINDIKKVGQGSQYKSAWNYDYRGLEKTSKLIYQNGSEGVFPYLEVKSDEDFKTVLSSLDKETEDIIICLGNNVKNVDFSALSRFENLVTLTIINTSVARESLQIWDDASFAYVYEYKEYELPSVSNMDALSSIKNLQTISLIGVGGDFSGMSKATSLREVYISGCVVENGDFQKLSKVNTLVTNNLLGSKVENGYIVSDDISMMSNIKFYMASGIGEVSGIIGKFSGLETLILRKMGEYIDWNELSLQTLENLYINMGNTMRISDEMLTTLQSLENLAVLKIDGCDSFYFDTIDAEILLKMDKLYSVTIPYCNILDKYFTGDRAQRTYASEDLANAIVGKTNLSQFIIERTVVESKVLDSSYISDVFDKKIYNAGIYSGFIDKYMISSESKAGASTIDAAIEKYLDALLVKDAESLCSSIVEDKLISYTNQWMDKSKNDVLPDILLKTFDSLGSRWTNDTKYLGYWYEIDENYNKNQVASDQKLINNLKEDGIDYKKVEEAINIELQIEGLEGAEKIKLYENIALVKISGKYYVWEW